MDAPVVIAPGEGELIGDAPDRRLEILCEDDAVHATWSRFAAGCDGADLHVHRHHTDVFYVLDGQLTVRLGEDDIVVPAGTLALVPPLVAHGFRNASDADMRYLNVHAPGLGFAAYLRGLRDGRPVAFDQEPPPVEGTRPTSEVVLATADGRESTVLADRQELTVAEARGAPGGPPPRERAHPDHVQSFYVLEGEIVVTTGDRELDAPAGSWVHVPPGMAHRVAFPQAARLLDLRTPAAA